MTLESAPHGTQRTAPRVSDVLERPELREELERLCRSEWRWGVPRQIRVRVRKAHTRRCTFEITVQTAHARRTLIGKAYARNRADIFQAMEAFVRAGFGPDGEFSIPQPLAFLAALGVRLEEKVAGPSAKDVLLTGDRAQHAAVARRCAGWLARFQAAAPRRLGKRIDPAAEVARCETWTEEIVRWGEPLAGKARALLTGLQRDLPATVAEETCATHGSYIPDHVILSGPRTVAIDLDEYGVADPAREVAWWVISLQRLALKSLGSFHALDHVAEEFLHAYRASGRGDGLPRYGFYRAVECLHRGRRDLLGRSPPAPEWTATMLDQGLEALAL
jgi:hypothetical protein